MVALAFTAPQEAWLLLLSCFTSPPLNAGMYMLCTGHVPSDLMGTCCSHFALRRGGCLNADQTVARQPFWNQRGHVQEVFRS